MNIEYSYKDTGAFHLALVAAGLPIRGIDRVGNRPVTAKFTRELTPAEVTQAETVHSGVGSWALSVATSGDDRVVSGMSAAYTFTVVANGEEIASGTDDTSPFEVTIPAPPAGDYVVSVVAADGTATGKIEFTVEA